MKSYKSGIIGIGSVFISIVLVLGGFLISFAEDGYTGYSFQSTKASPSATGLLFPTGSISSPTIISQTFISQTFTPSSTNTTTTTPSITATLTQTITTTYTMTAQPTLTRTNRPTITLTFTIPPIPTYCGPPQGWVLYIVQKGDTLYSLSLILGVPVFILQIANCIVNPNVLQTGSRIYIPFYIPTNTSIPTQTRTPTPARTKTMTSSPTPKPEPSPTLSETVNPPPTITQTLTQEPSFTSSPESSESPNP